MDYSSQPRELPVTILPPRPLGSSVRVKNDRRWNSHKDEIYGVYMRENNSLRTTMRMIEEKYGFRASTRSWKMKLKEWKFQKNLPSNDMIIIVAKADKRAREGDKGTLFFHGNLQISSEKIDGFKKRRTTKDAEGASPSADTPADITYGTPSATNGLDAVDTPVEETLVPDSRSPARDVVKSVLGEPSCVRCSLLGIECSGGDICIICLNLREKLPSASYLYAKQTLWFSACIRTRISEVSIFKAYLPSPALQSLILAKSHYLESSMIYLSFVSESTWDLSALVGEIAQWLNDATTSKTSEVGTLWSPQFLNLDKNTMTNSHRISYAESLAYTQADIKDNHSLNAFEIYQIGAIGGHELLNFLEEKLESQALEGCSREDLQALFLFVFGTILAVGSTRLISSQIAVLGVLTETSTPESKQFQTMKDFLCQILAHYLVFLGAQLKLPIPSRAEQFILEAAPAMWHKKGMFDWSIAKEDALTNLPSCGLQNPSQDQVLDGPIAFHFCYTFQHVDEFVDLFAFSKPWLPHLSSCQTAETEISPPERLITSSPRQGSIYSKLAEEQFSPYILPKRRVRCGDVILCGSSWSVEDHLALGQFTLCPLCGLDVEGVDLFSDPVSPGISSTDNSSLWKSLFPPKRQNLLV